jgi:hypothetical protein
MEDGPKAGGWDVSSEHPTGCAYVGDLDKWTLSYLGLPPLSFIDGGLAEDFSTLLITFESDTPDAIYFRLHEDLTYDVDDTGTTATISVHAPAMDVRYEDESPEEQTGPVELTVECANPFRYE